MGRLWVVAFCFVAFGLVVHGFGLPAFSRTDSQFNEDAFGDLMRVVEAKSSRPSIFPLGNDSDMWKLLLVAAAEQDIYTTANLALRRVEALQAQKSLLFGQLTCVGSQVVKSDRLSNPRLSYYIVESGERPSASGESFLPATVGIDTSLSDSCVPSAFLHLPTHYEHPMVSSSRRVLLAHEMDSGVEQYARRMAAEDSGHPEWTVVSMEEETTRVTFAVSEFVLGVVELPDQRYLIAVYRRSAAAPDQLVDRHVHVTLADEHANQYQMVITASSSPSRKRDTPSYTVSKFSRVASPESGIRARRSVEAQSLRIMTYNIWNYNADWNERKRMIAQFIHEQQPDLVGVQEIRYRYSGGPNQLTELAEELLQLNQSYYYVYQPAMYYDTEAEGVGVLSRLPIVDHDYINMTLVPGNPDGNRRIVLRTLVMNERNLFNFFASHFTYARGPGQMSNAYELLNFMKRQRPDIPQAVVADFNIYVGDEEPTNFLTGKLVYRGITGDLSDVWELAHGHNDLGYTFSNLPWSSGLINRADRMLIRNMPNVLVEPNTTVTTGSVRPGGNPASDHLAVSSLVHFTTAN